VKKPGPRRQRRHGRAGRPSGRRSTFIAVTVVAAIAVTVAFLLLRGATIPGFGTLTGRWLRLDGTYVLEIRSVAASGSVDATYLNPEPVNVARAEATREGSALKVFVELQAPGYPGSTYTLTYDPRNDQLTGVYYQAVLQQRFDVRFVRLK
jgi:hypothetical protein